MGWFVRFDRFGDSHLVFSQEQGMSCGLACCKMIVFKMNKLRPGGNSLTTEKQIETIYHKHDKRDVGKLGSFEGPLTKTLNELGAGNWAYQSANASQIPGLLLKYVKSDVVGAGPLVNSVFRGYPVIMGVCWTGGGGHFVVVDTVNKLPFSDTYYASVCDPGDGDVHIQSFDAKTSFAYKPSLSKYSYNFWGEPEQGQYDETPLNGVPDGVIYCQKAPGFWE